MGFTSRSRVKGSLIDNIINPQCTDRRLGIFYGRGFRSRKSSQECSEPNCEEPGEAIVAVVNTVARFEGGDLLANRWSLQRQGEWIPLKEGGICQMDHS